MHLTFQLAIIIVMQEVKKAENNVRIQVVLKKRLHEVMQKNIKDQNRMRISKVYGT
jgi:hypothetical protein